VIVDLSHIEFGPLVVAFQNLLDIDLTEVDDEAMLTTLKTRTLDKLWRLIRRIKEFLTEKTSQFCLTV
jgi:hypothetical protein